MSNFFTQFKLQLSLTTPLTGSYKLGPTNISHPALLPFHHLSPVSPAAEWNSIWTPEWRIVHQNHTVLNLQYCFAEFLHKSHVWNVYHVPGWSISGVGPLPEEFQCTLALILQLYWRDKHHSSKRYCDAGHRKLRLAQYLIPDFLQRSVRLRSDDFEGKWFTSGKTPLPSEMFLYGISDQNNF